MSSQFTAEISSFQKFSKRSHMQGILTSYVFEKINCQYMSI